MFNLESIIDDVVRSFNESNEKFYKVTKKDSSTIEVSRENILLDCSLEDSTLTIKHHHQKDEELISLQMDAMPYDDSIHEVVMAMEVYVYLYDI